MNFSPTLDFKNPTTCLTTCIRCKVNREKNE